tara:strand:- start:139 stop:279 length:141 start_codon:yes stop_codon:yes gene_type:complete
VDLEALLHKLEEAIESEDWDLVHEATDLIREDIDNPLSEYEEEDWG